MVEVYRAAHADPDADYSMLVSHILGAYGIEWHSNIIVTTKNRNVQACLEQFKAMPRQKLLKMKDDIIQEIKNVKDPDTELHDQSPRVDDLTSDCLCLAVASHVLDPERYPLIPYTSGFFKVESPVKRPPAELTTTSPVP
jgi:hypothetical protein